MQRVKNTQAQKTENTPKASRHLTATDAPAKRAKKDKKKTQNSTKQQQTGPKPRSKRDANAKSPLPPHALSRGAAATAQARPHKSKRYNKSTKDHKKADSTPTQPTRPSREPHHAKTRAKNHQHTAQQQLQPEGTDYDTKIRSTGQPPRPNDGQNERARHRKTQQHPRQGPGLIQQHPQHREKPKTAPGVKHRSKIFREDTDREHGLKPPGPNTANRTQPNHLSGPQQPEKNYRNNITAYKQKTTTTQPETTSQTTKIEADQKKTGKNPRQAADGGTSTTQQMPQPTTRKKREPAGEHNSIS
ncbi:hypothetical protein SAMN02745178_00015 [Gemmiger formicilis]|uniref:Uncharacterized protein n=1 Tax=Gemmiger formicilis TaxID=745368 RepID=A0A1T4W6G5_9FIRM|nr:hypothetical protein SAMN02745178_00015 [Gemmiger formicilis]